MTITIKEDKLIVDGKGTEQSLELPISFKKSLSINEFDNESKETNEVVTDDNFNEDLQATVQVSV